MIRLTDCQGVKLFENRMEDVTGEAATLMIDGGSVMIFDALEEQDEPIPLRTSVNGGPQVNKTSLAFKSLPVCF